MPKNKSYKKTNKRKNNKVKKYSKYRKATVTRNPTLFPDRLYCTMNLTISYTTQNQANILSLLSVAGNDLFRPIRTQLNPNPFGSVQPTGFQVYKQLYYYYRVHACKIIVSVVNASTQSTPFVAVVPTDKVVNIATFYSDWASMQYAKSRMMGTSSGGHDGVTIKHYMKSRKILGLKNLADELDYCGTSITSPAVDWMFNIVQVIKGGTMSTETKVTVQYFVEWFGRVSLLQPQDSLGPSGFTGPFESEDLPGITGPTGPFDPTQR